MHHNFLSVMSPLLAGCHHRHVRLRALITGTLLLAYRLSVYYFVADWWENIVPNSLTDVLVCHCRRFVVVRIHGCQWLVLDVTLQWTPLQHFSDSQDSDFMCHIVSSTAIYSSHLLALSITTANSDDCHNRIECLSLVYG
jgi:hypothetical protein